MRVICSGLPKTGTKTMCAALRMLGYQVYDFEEQLLFLGHELKRALDVGTSSDELRDMFETVDAITDLPGCALWEELANAFPDAKIIHTERSSDAEWADSMRSQMLAVFNHPWMTTFGYISSPTGRKANNLTNSAFRVLLSRSSFESWKQPPLNMTMEKMKYRQHNHYIRTAAPKDRLLVFDVRDGWEPLCKFLRVPVPPVEFPHKNKSGSEVTSLLARSRMSDKIRREAYCFIVLILVVVLALCILMLAIFLR